MIPELSGRDYRWLRLAEKLAHTVTDNHKHGCVIVRGGSIVSVGTNLYANGVHAEMSAINKSKQDLAGTTIYICRLRKEQAWGLSAPCVKCEALIKESGIRRVVYSTNDPLNPIFIWRF